MRNPSEKAALQKNLKNWAIQIAALIVILICIGGLASNANHNLRQQGIASGFGFLESTAGFDILMHIIDYDEQSSYGQAFVVSLLNTLLVSICGIALASGLGFAVGIARLSNNWLIAKAASFYVEALRNTPLLLQLFFWYFSVLRTLPAPKQSFELLDLVFLNIRGLYIPWPQLTDTGQWLSAIAFLMIAIPIGLKIFGSLRDGRWNLIPLTGAILGLASLGLANWTSPQLRGFNFTGGVVIIPEFVALWIALSTYTAAFIAEIVRAGILAVPKGQVEAAQALGLSRSQTLRLVVTPQAMRLIIPPLTSQYLNLTKNSSLAAAIAYPDLVLVFAGTVLMQTGQAVEIIFLTMSVYLCISIFIAVVMNYYNHTTKKIGG